MQNLRNLQNLQGITRPQIVSVSDLTKLYSYITGLSGLVAYYPLDEPSGAAINRAPDTVGTLNGTVTGATQGAAGLIGKAYSFDGVGDYITVANNAALQLNEDMTLFVIFYLDDLANYYSIFNKFIDDMHGEFHMRINQTSGNWFLQQPDGVGEFGVGYDTSGEPGIVVAPTGEWASMAITKDTAHVKFYPNGVVGTTRDTSVNVIPTTNADLVIGARGGFAHFKGKMQHAAIFNRALTEAENLKLAQLAGLA